MKAKDSVPVLYLDQLKKWLLVNDWELQELKADNEVLRARKSKGIFILIKTNDPNYYCMSEHHGKAVRSYIKTLKEVA